MFLLLLLCSLLVHYQSSVVSSSSSVPSGFVTTRGTRLMVDGRSFYVNGFNAYWMPLLASDHRDLVTSVLEQASSFGLSVARTWAFNDGSDYHAIQTKPGVFNERSFQALDFVIAEASKNRVKLILSLSNNYDAFGGKPQYVRWAREAGISCFSDDSFFTDPTIRGYFKNYVQAVLTRKNTLTGITYRDDPTILAWELMNEPQVPSDPSGDVLEAWVDDLSRFIKSIDSNHLLELGMEGFYSSAASSGLARPNRWSSSLGTDFVRHNRVPGIDFATVHTYPDLWMPNAGTEKKLGFLRRWVADHIALAQRELGKPVLFAEFGTKRPEERDRFLATLYSRVYRSARAGGAGVGALVWQIFPPAMDPAWDDGFQIMLDQSPSTARIIAAQSRRLAALSTA